jgi:hypothetical protein
LNLSFSYSPPPVAFLPDQAVLAATSRYFIWEVDGEIAAIGGEILPDAVGNRVYLWLSLSQKRFSLPVIRQGLSLVKQYLSSLPWVPYAECAFNASRNEKFLLSCGFRPIINLDDRILYRWSL